MRYLLLALLAGCGQFTVKGGTTNRVETTGKTTVEIVLTIDQKLCDGQPDVTVCLANLNTLLQDFLKTLQDAKEMQK